MSSPVSDSDDSIIWQEQHEAVHLKRFAGLRSQPASAGIGRSSAQLRQAFLYRLNIKSAAAAAAKQLVPGASTPASAAVQDETPASPPRAMLRRKTGNDLRSALLYRLKGAPPARVSQRIVPSSTSEGSLSELGEVAAASSAKDVVAPKDDLGETNSEDDSAESTDDDDDDNDNDVGLIAAPTDTSASMSAFPSIMARRTRTKCLETAPTGPAVQKGDASWVPSAGVRRCQHCTRRFTVLHRKHHCRACGALVCAGCSPYRTEMYSRQCRQCHALVNGRVLRAGDESAEMLVDCAAQGDVLELQYRIEHGAPVDIAERVFGVTALIAAAGAGQVEVVRELLELGADVNRPSFSMTTPLHAGARSGSAAVVALLLRANADTQALDSCGRTPAQVAVESGNTSVMAQFARSEGMQGKDGMRALTLSSAMKLVERRSRAQLQHLAMLDSAAQALQMNLLSVRDSECDFLDEVQWRKDATARNMDSSFEAAGFIRPENRYLIQHSEYKLIAQAWRIGHVFGSDVDISEAVHEAMTALHAKQRQREQDRAREQAAREYEARAEAAQRSRQIGTTSTHGSAMESLAAASSSMPIPGAPISEELSVAAQRWQRSQSVSATTAVGTTSSDGLGTSTTSYEAPESSTSSAPGGGVHPRVQRLATMSEDSTASSRGTSSDEREDSGMAGFMEGC